jgi:hypothetical protein
VITTLVLRENERGRQLRRHTEEVMALFYDETTETPTKIGGIIGSIFGIYVYVMMAWLMVYPLWHSH